ncbi:MAG: MFS transporter [Bacteroidia bacterium]|nr:MFS transporter [Bacteroidia bacterium]
MKQAAGTPLQDPSADLAQKTVYAILFSISFSHMLNDMMQSVIPSVYPMIKDKYQLSFTQIGLITFAFQLTASLLQPFVGIYTDRRPQPYSFVIGMFFSLAGIILLSQATGFYSILLAVSCVGVGSSVFHPESSKVAYYASGGRRGLAQSIFQLGGNFGSAIGPLLVAAIVVPRGQYYILWFMLAAFMGIFVLSRVGVWYRGFLSQAQSRKKIVEQNGLSRRTVVVSVVILLVLIFSKYFYMAGITSYLTFYLIEKFSLSVQQSQLYLFLFLISVAAGTLIGGPLGDRFGRKIIIWASILGAAPFTLLLPYADLFWTGILIAIIGFIMASAFSAILVYAQELMPGKIGMISGLFFGFAFGMGGLGSAVLGKMADYTGIAFVYKICAFLPLIGLVTAFLPDLRKK